MDVNTKVKELEDELKVLKTEIRNVLLDVREVILDRANPLSEQEPAYLRVDLKTTAQTIAAEEAARLAGKSADEAARAAAKAAEQRDEERAKDELEQPKEPEESDILATLPEDEAAEQATGEEQAEDETAAQSAEEEQPEDELEGPEDEGPPEPEPPKQQAPRRRKRHPEAGLEPAEISAAYRFYPPIAVGTGSLAAWVAEALAAIGPQQLDRVITIHRLWGYLPPNISQALAHLQELIRCSQEPEPPWLTIMQDMERLSSS
jgi:hypothetical protein